MATVTNIRYGPVALPLSRVLKPSKEVALECTQGDFGHTTDYRGAKITN